MNEFSERLIQVFDYYKFKTTAEFASKTGLSHQTATNYLEGKRKPDASKLKSIIQALNELSAEWLITGQGEMIKSEINILHKAKSTELKIPRQEIPLYDIEATAGVVSLFKDPNNKHSDDTISIPNMPNCDGAITVTGDSMYPIIKSGDIVIYKAIQEIPKSIFFGQTYIVSINVEGDEMTLIKYVKEGSDQEHINLVSHNPHHADKEVHIKFINAMALVKASIRFNTLT